MVDKHDEIEIFAKNLADAIEVKIINLTHSNSNELPSFRLEVLDEDNETEKFEDEAKRIYRTITDQKISDPEEIYGKAEFNLDNIPKHEYDDMIARARRNNFGRSSRVDANEAGSAYVAAGVVAVIAASKVNSIVSKKFDSRSGQLEGGPITPLPGQGPPINQPWVPNQPGWTDPPPPDFSVRIFDRISSQISENLNERE